MTFTADNLPEAVRVIYTPCTAFNDASAGVTVLNAHAAAILNRLCASRPGLREWLLNGTAPAFTDEPPEVTAEDRSLAYGAYLDDDKGMGEILKADRARVWQTHRPKPVDAARFALEKVTRNQWAEFVHAVLEAASTPETDTHYVAREELARILPVAEPPPRKVEVTVEAVNAFLALTGLASMLAESIDDPRYVPLVSAIRAAFHLANSQAEARESEAVAEVARLRSESMNLTQKLDELRQTLSDAEEGHISDVERLTKERDEASKELTALQAHAAKLESYMTLYKMECSPVKLWLPFEARVNGEWRAAETHGAIIRVLGTSPLVEGPYALFDLRQTPAPEAELKRWEVKIAVADTRYGSGWTIVTTEPMTRNIAEQIGEVIGEA